MEKYAFIEISVFALFIILFRHFISSKRNVSAFIAVFTVVCLLEIINEKVFAAQGTFYPVSLFYFPFFRFPVAIACMGVLYAFAIYFSALRITDFFKTSCMKKTIFMISITLLNFVSLAVEKAGMISGYWIHQKAVGITEIWFGIYLFYYIIILSGAFFFLFRITGDKSTV